MIRIIVNFYILKSAKKLKMPTFITAIVAKTYFGASFLTNFVCFAALKNFWFLFWIRDDSEIVILILLWFRDFQRKLILNFSLNQRNSEIILNYLWFSTENLNFSEFVLIQYWWSLKVRYGHGINPKLKYHDSALNCPDPIYSGWCF